MKDLSDLHLLSYVFECALYTVAFDIWLVTIYQKIERSMDNVTFVFYLYWYIYLKVVVMCIDGNMLKHVSTQRLT